MAKRKAITKKIRFEVFKRDSFKCQYCGAAAPDVLLEVDHIQPVSKGGAGDILNLITACQSCNSGKSNRELSDDSAVSKQRDQLEALNERREQLEMMLNWRKGLSSLREDAIDGIADTWNDLLRGQFSLNEKGLQDVRGWLNKFSVAQIVEAMEIAAAQYIKVDESGKITTESANYALGKVSGIARNRANPEADSMREFYYIRGILRRRLSFVNEWLSIELLKRATAAGAEIDQLKDIARTVRNWSQFAAELNDIIEGGAE